MGKKNKYDPEEHEEYITCPRCQNRNAPQDHSDFKPHCWNCNEHLGVTPVSVNEEYIIDITDIHSSGAGVGHTEDGFVLLVEGVLPEKKVKVRVTNVKDTYAWADLIETVADDIDSAHVTEEVEDEETKDSVKKDEEDEEDETVRLGSRENHWGR